MATELDIGTTPEDEKIEETKMDHSDIDAAEKTDEVEEQPNNGIDDSMKGFPRIITIISLYFIMVCELKQPVDS